MKKNFEKVISSANRAGKALFGSSISRKIASAALAFTVALSPVVPSLAVMADETQDIQEVVEETTDVQVEAEVTEATIPSETSLPDCSECTTETVITEDVDIVVVDPTETIDTTAPPTEQETEPAVSETTVEQKTNIISANENNFADLIADLPSANRLIVYCNDALDTEATGIYYDGVYYLSYSTEDAMFDDLCAFDAKGIPFAIDGCAKVCGGLISYQAGVINPSATTKIAVIDTGSNLANEKYSVIGDDLKDYNGHGTAMVNNILAQTDDAYVISIKTMADDGTGNVSDICAAVQLATDLKVDIIFMALSFKDSGDYDAFKKLVKEAQNQNITVIASAGNNSADAAKYLPAGISGVITVGAILSDERNKSPVSNYGSAVDYYVVANYTSDAASIFAGKYIAGNIDDVATSCIMQGRPNEVGEDDPVVNAKRTLDRYNDTKGAYIYITAQQQRNMGYTCSDDFRDDIINAAKYLSGVDYGTYANNHGTEYEQAFLCLDYVHMVYGMIVIPTGHDNPGVAGEGDFERHGRQSTTAAPRISNGHAWWWAWFSLNTDNDVGGKKYIGSPYYLYPYVQGTSVPYWTTNVVRPVDNISQNNCYDCSVSCTDSDAMRALNMERGDLVFFGPVASGDNAGGFGHAAIYSGTNGYFYDCGSTTSGNHYRADGAIVNGPGNYNRMMVYKIEDFDDRGISLTVEKSSSNPSVSNGNDAYNFAGTTYELYSGNSLVATFVMKSNGTTDTVYTATLGSTYTLKETVAGKGFELDTKTYTISVSSNGNISINNGASVDNNSTVKIAKVTDSPEETEISLTKASSNSAVTNGNSCYSLAGTTYGLFSDPACTSRVATFTVDANGNTATKFTSPYDKTYYLKELVAGKGYELDGRVYTVNVYEDGTVGVDRGVTTTLSGGVYYMHLSDIPMKDDIRITIDKTLSDGTIVPNDTGAYNGAKFRLEYYSKEVSDFGSLTYADADIVFEFTVNARTTVINRPFLARLTPVKGTNTFTSFSGNAMPLGTYRLQEIDAPDGFSCAPDYWILTIYDDPVNDDQLIRTRTKITADGQTSVSTISVGNVASDTYISINEPIVMGRFHLNKEIQEKNIISDVSRYTFKLYANSGTNGAEELIATGTTDRDGNVLWTYAGKGLTLTGNDNKTPLSQRILESGLSAGKTHNIILPVWKTNTEKFNYTVYEYRPDTKYGTTDIEYTASVPSGWTKVSDNEFKMTFTLDANADVASKQYAEPDNETPLTSKTVVNHEEFTGLNVKKVVPVNNPFDVTKVIFKVYNTDNGKDTLIANGTVDSRGNVTWYRVNASGFGTDPTTSINILNNLPLGHYRIEETWDKEYLDLNDQISVLIEEKNNNIGWVKSETRTTYTYTYALDLSDKSNDKSVLPLNVENEKFVQEFNLVKDVTVAGDASTIKAELYLISDDQVLLISTGTVTTNGIGSYGFTWDYKGTHKTVDGIDTLELPIGNYRVIEYCPETYFKDTKIPYTYMTPEGFTSKLVDGKLQFYKDFELKRGEYKTLKTTITNVRIEGSFDIIKVERSDIASNKTFTFEVYYRGNGAAASDTATLIEKVTITTVNGKGSASLNKLPEGWYEIREVGTGSDWISHWANTDSVVNGNKIIQLTSKDRTIAAPSVNDGIKENGTAINAVVCYNDVKPEIKTTLIDRGTDAHITTCSETAELVDTVSYKNLMPGHYAMSGALQDKNSGGALMDKDGNVIVGSTEFDVPEVLDEYGQPIPQSGKVEVIFALDTTKIEGTVIVAFEELHKDSLTGELVAEHKDINDVEQTVVVPSVKTTAIDSDNGTHTFTYKERVNITDKVAYTDLIVGRTYVATGTLMNVATGEIYKDSEGKTYTAFTEFKATKKDGFVFVEFKDVLVPYDKTTIVVFEDITDKEKGVKVAVHADLTDKDQTVERPTAHTIATINGNKVIWLASTEVRNLTITDTISYTGLEVGSLYRAEATLFKVNGTQLMVDAQPIKSIVEFTPDTKDGTVDVKITFSTEGLSEGDKIVVFEKIYDVATEIEIADGTQTENLLIARHEDLNDSDQTITIHFRPTTGEIVPTYTVIGAGLVALSALIAAFLFRRKKRFASPK